uniref:Uncharacterized protein n=1 Tax=Meloidogyne enterolobii TaxID=390850 RepID=A0A6V7TNR5_MELEN|nr:unnamed protein product [Meloidogyne enterolobii]
MECEINTRHQKYQLRTIRIVKIRTRKFLSKSSSRVTIITRVLLGYDRDRLGRSSKNLDCYLEESQLLITENLRSMLCPQKSAKE